MHIFIREIIERSIRAYNDEPLEDFSDKIAREIVSHPAFTAQHAQRIPTLPDLGMGEHFNHQWSKLMSTLTEAMTALGQLIAANKSPETAAHLQAIDDHLSSIDGKQTTDEAAIADQKDGLQALLTAAAGTTETAAGGATTTGTDTAAAAAGTTGTTSSGTGA